MLFQLSVKNFKKSIRDYFIYFFTLILGIAIFYIFNAIETQTAIMEVSKTKADIIDMMNTVLEGVSVLISFILGYLIVYASSFMLKKRKKEFGIYLTLGMGKRQVAGILWLETVLMGMISLAAGLGAGIGLSQFMSLLVSYFFQADMSRFVFVISWKAAGKTLLYFLIIYGVVMIFNTWAVSRAKLLDFLTADRKKEKNLLKKPGLCVIVFLFAWGILGTAYYNVTAGQSNLVTEFDVLLQIFLGTAGTFLVFWSVSGLFAAVAGKFHRMYHKGLNSFSVGEISNKLNSTVLSGGIICLLIFMTICILAAAFTRKDYKEKLAEELAPASVSMVKDMVEEREDPYSIEKVMKQQGVSLEAFKDIVDIYSYESDEVTKQTVLGSYLEENFDKYGEDFASLKYEMIKVSDYNKVALLYNLPQYRLAEDEYMAVANSESGMDILNKGLAANQEFTYKGKIYHAKYKKCREGFVQMSYDKSNFGFLLMPDSAEFTEEEMSKNYFIANYRKDTREFRNETDTHLSEQMNPDNKDHAFVNISTQSNIYDDTIGSNAMFIFLGLYLGISFLIAGAAVLALKVLSDAADSKEKYGILRKLGCEEKTIRRALWKQNGVFFLFPLILAGIHSIFGIQVSNFIMSVYGTESMLPGISVAAGLVILIYGGYFLVAQICCMRVIKGT